MTKDWWDILDIIGKVLIPVTITIFGLIANYRIAELNRRLTTKTRDVDIMERFSNIYYYEEHQDSRRLSLHFVKLVDDAQTRFVLRQFVIWDALERNITSNFKFDQELSDWHLFGDAIYDMAEDDHEKANWFWCNLKITTQKRWPQHEAELIKLYGWIRDSYQKDGLTWADCSSILWRAVRQDENPNSGATLVEQSPEHATEGQYSLRFDFVTDQKRDRAVFSEEIYLNLEAFTTLSFDMYNATNQPLEVTLAISTADEEGHWIWHETKKKTLEVLNNHVTFSLDATDYKTKASGWKHTQSIANRDKVRQLSIIIFPEGGLSGSVYLDNLRLE